MKDRFFRLAFLVTAIFLSLHSAEAQSGASNKDDEVSLKDISEAVLVNGKPALKILSPKKGGYTEVKLLKRDGEDALVFDVVKLSVKNPVGKLFVTKTKIIFDALGNKEKSFSIDKTGVKRSTVRKSVDGFPSIDLDIDDFEAKLQIKFDRFQHLIDRASQRAAHDFLYRAISDFDAALKDFKELTESAFPVKDN